MYYTIKEVAHTLIKNHFKAHNDALVRLSQRKLGELFAEDAVQDTYERCLKYYDRIPLAVNLDKFVMTMLINRIKDYQRGNIPHEEVEESMWETGDLASQMRARGVLGEVMKELSTYDEGARTVLYLYLIQGEPAYDVSRVTGVSVSNIRKLSERFRTTIKEKYETV